MSTARKTHQIETTAQPTEAEAALRARVSGIQAALDAGGLATKVRPDGTLDARSFADAVMARWPRVMAKLGE